MEESTTRDWLVLLFRIDSMDPRHFFFFFLPSSISFPSPFFLLVTRRIRGDGEGQRKAKRIDVFIRYTTSMRIVRS